MVKIVFWGAWWVSVLLTSELATTHVLSYNYMIVEVGNSDDYSKFPTSILNPEGSRGRGWCWWGAFSDKRIGGEVLVPKGGWVKIWIKSCRRVKGKPHKLATSWWGAGQITLIRNSTLRNWQLGQYGTSSVILSCADTNGECWHFYNLTFSKTQFKRQVWMTNMSTSENNEFVNQVIALPNCPNSGVFWVFRQRRKLGHHANCQPKNGKQALSSFLIYLKDDIWDRDNSVKKRCNY